MLNVEVLSLFLILVMLYLAFNSLLDVMLVYVNVVAMSMLGLWALVLTGLNFNISASAAARSDLGGDREKGFLQLH